MSFSVLGIGEAYLDYISVVDSYPAENGVVFSSDFDTQGGGCCANVLVALSRLGLETSLIARIGTDDIGDKIAASLQEENVGLRYMERRSGVSPLSFVIVSQEKNTRTSVVRKDTFHLDEFDIAPSCLDGINLLEIGGWYPATELRLCTMAQERGIPIFMEAEHCHSFSEQLLPFADVVITSKEFHLEVFSSDAYEQNLASLREKGAKKAIATLGEQGSLLLSEDGTMQQNAISVDVVDTTGAGDAFMAGMIYGFLQQWGDAKSLEFASRIAAQKCTQLGSRRGLPCSVEGCI